MKKAVLLFTVFLASCGYYKDKTGGAGDRVSLAPSELAFASVQSTVFGPKCVTCHEQYGSYAAVRRDIDSIVSAVESGRMPKSGPLSDQLKQILRDWVAAGAPEFPGSITPPQPIQLEPIWDSVKNEIFTPRCNVCHNPNGQAKFLDLSTKEAILSAKDRMFGGTPLIDSADPENSYLIQVVRDPDEPMPPTWSNIRRLNEEEITVLKDWIGRGLP